MIKFNKYFAENAQYSDNITNGTGGNIIPVDNQNVDYYAGLQTPREAVITFGRFNPPTKGHAALVEQLSTTAHACACEGYIFPTHTTGNAKNPLTFKEKEAILVQMINGDNKLSVMSEGATIMQALRFLADKGVTVIHHVAGSDRIPEFEDFVERCNGKPDKSGNIPFAFDEYNMVSAGERDPDAEGIEGVSASKLRALAVAGDLQGFAEGMDDDVEDNLKRDTYDKIRERTK